MNAAEAGPERSSLLVVTADAELVRRFAAAVPANTSLAHTVLAEAEAYIRGAAPDVVILDVGESPVQGLALCRDLSSRPEFDHTPVVVLLPADGHLISQAFDAGATDYLTSPVSKDRLGQRLQALLYNARRHAALRHDRDRYRTFLDAVPDMIFQIDRDGIIRQFRPGQGIAPLAPPERFLGHSVREFLPAAVADRAQAVHEHAMQSGEPQSYEYSLNTADGPRDYEVRVVVSGSDTVMGLVRDITQRKRAETALRSSEARLLGAQRMARLGHWDVDLLTGEHWCSPEAAAMLGMDSEGTSDDLWGALHPDDRPRVQHAIENAIAEDTPCDLEFRVLHPDGTKCHLHAVAESFRDEQGNALRLGGTVLDLTERKRVEEALRESERLLATHLRHTPLAAIAWDTEFRVTEWNPAAEQVFGYQRNEVMGENAADLIVPPRLRDKVRGVYDALIAQRGGHRSTNANITKDGREILCEWYNTPLTSEDGTVIGVASLVEDITEREMAAQRLRNNEARLDHLAHHDALTRLPNRLLFQDRLEQAMRTCHRSSEQVAVLLLDLDRFKYINDSLGHATGDRFLGRIAERLRLAIRESDTVARLGGDEFVVVMNGLSEAKGAATLAEKLLLSIASPVILDQHELYSSASLGISIYPQDGSSVDELLQCADMAMYQAKGAGHNLFKFYTPDMNRRTQQVLRIERDLRRALEQSQLVVYYQPQINLNDSSVVAVEALLRQACEQTRAWQLAGLETVRVAVNLSALQFQRPELVETVASVLSETKLLPRFLELELTESSIMNDPTAASEVLRALDGMGVRLAIDDFGTGYSSLSHLKRFPLHRLKIDRSFVDGVTTDPNDAEIARAVIALARSMSLEVIAEGVETEAQRIFLLQEGCQHGQGNLFGPPAPAVDTETFLQPGEPG